MKLCTYVYYMDYCEKVRYKKIQFSSFQDLQTLKPHMTPLPLQIPSNPRFLWPQIEVQFHDLINTFQQGIEFGATDLS